jgi:hypothetical protein
MESDYVTLNDDWEGCLLRRSMSCDVLEDRWEQGNPGHDYQPEGSRFEPGTSGI